MTNVSFLIGLPCVGKSTVASAASFKINRDEIVSAVAANHGLTYDEMFSTPVEGEVEHARFGTVVPAPEWMTWCTSVYSNIQAYNNEVDIEFNARVAQAHLHNEVVIDMTNLHKDGRLAMVEKLIGDHPKENFSFSAIIFETKNIENVIKLSEIRAEKLNGKNIPAAVFHRMANSFTDPVDDNIFETIEIIKMDDSIAQWIAAS